MQCRVHGWCSLDLPHEDVWDSQNELLLLVCAAIVATAAVGVIAARFGAAAGAVSAAFLTFLLPLYLVVKLLGGELGELGGFFEGREHVEQDGLLSDLEELEEDVVPLDRGVGNHIA